MSIPFFGTKSAELTGEDANVRVVYLAVMKIGRKIAVLAFPYKISDGS